eukprot:Clim_evm204s157 gene=Clim_evmTU204s157
MSKICRRVAVQAIRYSAAAHTRNLQSVVAGPMLVKRAQTVSPCRLAAPGGNFGMFGLLSARSFSGTQKMNAFWHPEKKVPLFDPRLSEAPKRGVFGLKRMPTKMSRKDWRGVKARKLREIENSRYKMKTKKGLAKRVIVLPGGVMKRWQAGKNHFNWKKSTARKLRLRRPVLIPRQLTKRLMAMLPYWRNMAKHRGGSGTGATKGRT